VVFIGSAASLFLLTILAENNASWFPAISRANKAMAKTKKQAEAVSNRSECTFGSSGMGC
jgi:hypothetical protein